MTGSEYIFLVVDVIKNSVTVPFGLNLLWWTQCLNKEARNKKGWAVDLFLYLTMNRNEWSF